MATVYLGLGSNLGDRLALLRAAVAELGALGRVDATSSVYETEPWGDPDQPAYLNACCRLETALPPPALHAAVKAIEQKLGRRPSSRRWGPRPIDIDLLVYEDVVVETPELQVPHPRLAERAFVLVPLAELAPELKVPGLAGSVAEQLARLGNVDPLVRPFDRRL